MAGPPVEVAADIITTWMYAICMIGFFSQLWKENPLHKLVEYTFIGIAVGNSAVMAMNNIVNIGLLAIPTPTGFDMIIAIILGLMILTTFSTRYRWTSRWSYAILLGTQTGLAIRTTPHVSLWRSVKQTIVKGADVMQITTNPMLALAGFVFFACVILVMATFTYTKEIKGAYSGAMKIGRYLVLAYVGGIMVMYLNTRLSVFYSELRFLIVEWLQIV